MIDGLAISQFSYLAKHIKSRANLYKINSQDFYRQSGALHEMYLTGKFSNNFVADPILIDNLFLQMNKADHKLNFIGTPYPVAYLAGGHKNLIYFNKSFVGEEEYPFENICPSLRDTIYNGVGLKLPLDIINDESKLISFLDQEIASYPMNITECLAENGVFSLGNANLNLIYYTAMIDNHNHAFSKTSPHAFKVTYGIEKFALKMMDWIDENPDYALFFSSDHGGQDFFGEDSYCNHGCLKDGNQGIFFSYVKEFNQNLGNNKNFNDEIDSSDENEDDGVIIKNNNNVNNDDDSPYLNKKLEIDIFDVAPTVTQLIENANIPIFARGKPAELGDNGWFFLKF